jgi:geranylgeranyl diphosphate synthase, type I
MVFEKMAGEMLPDIEDHLKGVIIANIAENNCSELAEMLCYHMGWEGEGVGPAARGKRIRPLLVLLCCAAAGSDWRPALPAAAAVELLHNFSLIHDDIQDQSFVRRGRPTLWTKWGIAQAINAGDLMFTLANKAIFANIGKINDAVIIQAADILHQTSILLTKGQFLDLSFEKEKTLPLEAYWPMISGKTAALLAASCQLGGLIAGIDPRYVDAFGEFGRLLGLAFQVHDDYLGIWGDASLTGKSNESDLVSGKKSLPVLFALTLNKAFSKRWLEGNIKPEDVSMLADLMVIEGAEAYTKETVDRLTLDAIQALDRTGGTGEAMAGLKELTSMLLNRVK